MEVGSQSFAQEYESARGTRYSVSERQYLDGAQRLKRRRIEHIYTACAMRSE